VNGTSPSGTPQALPERLLHRLAQVSRIAADRLLGERPSDDPVVQAEQRPCGEVRERDQPRAGHDQLRVRSRLERRVTGEPVVGRVGPRQLLGGHDGDAGLQR
jgi:hypothetical protein